MKVQSSHLCLRFYKHDGWTSEILESCLDKGTVEFCGEGLDYYRLTQGSRFDVDKLMKHITFVKRWYSGDHRESNKEYIKGMNW